jgi:hypothetical protein
MTTLNSPTATHNRISGINRPASASQFPLHSGNYGTRNTIHTRPTGTIFTHHCNRGRRMKA